MSFSEFRDVVGGHDRSPSVVRRGEGEFTGTQAQDLKACHDFVLLYQ